jgi:hypothetical protein
MKTRLLKRLRKRFILERRNKEYRFVDREHSLRIGTYTPTRWTTFADAYDRYSDIILYEARINYKVAKKYKL